MLRPILLKIASRAKAGGAVDFAIRCNPYLRSRILRAMRRSREQQAALTEELTRSILRAARRTRYGAGKPMDIHAWPVLEKEMLAASPQDFVNPSCLVRVPAGTGGTTGIPLKLWRSLESVVAEQAFLDDLLSPFGFSMHRSRVAVLRADTIKPPQDKEPPFGRLSHGGNRLTLSSLHLNAETLQWFLDALEKFQPQILWVYPSSVINLLKLLEQAGKKRSIPVILTSSETLPGTVHEALEQYFQATVINYYGQAERACFAYSTKPNEFYFHPCYGRVELNIAEPAESGAFKAVKIIGTNYWNKAMPLIRYNTGDLLYVPASYGQAELDEIARGKRPFTGLAGREGEYIVTRDGMRIIGLNHVPREVEHILQLQLVQTDFDTLHINVLALPGFNEQDAEHIKAQARAKVPAAMQIHVNVVDRLRTTERGKTPLVIRTF